MGRVLKAVIVLAVTAALAACATRGGADSPIRGAMRRPVVTDPAPIVPGTMRRYQVRGRWYQPVEQPGYVEVGLASWYGDAFNGRPTATGEIFDMHALTAAHKTLPLPGLVEVTNLANGRTVVLRVNDRGPFVDGRLIDLSRGAADALGLLSQGVGEVRVRYLGPAPRGGGTGMAGPAVSTVQGPAGPEASPGAGPVDVFWVQAGAFADRARAEAVADRLGRRAHVQRIDTNGQRLFRVIVGPWADANAAEEGRQTVISQGFPDALLISGR
ncbi:septal ring lytic transglycosylase RlpA family protein [Rhizobium sp. CRIBSB]|nr:septal ring lytic transglycosylase RlpA family protein [Rhizobium sp. CRIBSB]